MTSRLEKIAHHAGVSKATVSRVLNEQPGVSDEFRGRVLSALDVLGYERPTRLRPRSAGLIGLVVPELENPIFPLFAQVIGYGLSRQNYTPVLCVQTPDSVGEDEYVAMLLDRGVAGIIFVSGLHTDPALDHSRYRDLVARRLPIVLVNGYLDDVDAPFISCDNEAAGKLAVEHLVSLKHHRIALATGHTRHSPVNRQLEGYRAAMKTHCGGFDLVATSFFGVEGGYAAAMQLLSKDKEVSAIVCGSDLAALGVIRAVRQRGRSVPGDVSVIGYDDSILMGFTDPPMTTIRQPALSMGATAVRMLMDEIHGHGAPRGESLFQPELVIRSSTWSRSPASPENPGLRSL
ncbi:MAG: LacI family DNA-binding transcriptional regulator [Pseudonocardiaceae bacterium]